MVLRSRAALEARHPHHREVLTMALFPAVVLAALLLEDEDFLRLLVADDLPDHAHAGEERLAGLDGTFGGREQDLVERARRARLTRELLEPQRVPGAHPVLLAA